MRLPGITCGLVALALTGCSADAPTSANNGANDGANDGGGAAGVAPPTAVPQAPAAPASSAGYVGRWTGVEGLYLVVADRAGEPGSVSLDMQYDLDNTGRFDGRVTDRGVEFTRNGVAEIARRTDGDATGLKYLAGRTDCLTVKPGEGYCR